MRKFVRNAGTLCVVALAILLVTPAAPPAQAAPSSDIWTHYYDCGLHAVGEKFRGCGSSATQWGQLSGYYKEIESCSCEGATCTITWYYWNGSSWISLGSDKPDPAC